MFISYMKMSQIAKLLQLAGANAVKNIYCIQ